MKRIVVSVMFLLITLLGLSYSAFAAAPTCHTYNSVPYCAYSGRVVQAYVNHDNLILLYFDTAMDLAKPANVGIAGVTNDFAAAYRLADNVEFGKLLYSSMLAAQSRGGTIKVQMRGSYNGYLLIDRIWVYE